MLDLNRMGFLVEFFESTELEPELIGSSFIEPSNLQSSEGTIKVPIFSSGLNPIEGGRPLDRDDDQDNVSKYQNPIGKLTLKYCVVRPMENADYNLSRTYVSYWSKNWKSLDVGHRYKYISLERQTLNRAVDSNIFQKKIFLKSVSEIFLFLFKIFK